MDPPRLVTNIIGKLEGTSLRSMSNGYFETKCRITDKHVVLNSDKYMRIVFHPSCIEGIYESDKVYIFDAMVQGSVYGPHLDATHIKVDREWF